MAESVQILSISHRHAAIADLMLAEPTLRKGEVAKRMGVSQSWLSIVINSDTFKEYWASRRGSFEQEMREKLLRQQLSVASKVYDKMDGMLDNEDLKPQEVLATGDHILKALGYEPRGKTRVTETKTIEHSVDADVLADARARMTRRQTVTIEHEAP